MKRWILPVAIALQTVLQGSARADEPAPAAPATASPKRPVPDYDGRGPRAHAAGRRGAVGPARPPVAAVPRQRVRPPCPALDRRPRRGERRLAEEDLRLFHVRTRPQGGLRAGRPRGVQLQPERRRLRVLGRRRVQGRTTCECTSRPGPTTGCTDPSRNASCSPTSAPCSFASSGLTRPDKVFYGLGPNSLQSSQSRYEIQRVDAGAAYEWRFWRSSRIETAVGVRDVNTKDGHFGNNPTLTQEAATGAFSIPLRLRPRVHGRVQPAARRGR